MDETYTKAKVNVGDLYRASDKDGDTINADRAPTYGIATARLKKDDKLTQLAKRGRGLTTLRMAYATIRGFEVMRALKKGRSRPSRRN